MTSKPVRYVCIYCSASFDHHADCKAHFEEHKQDPELLDLRAAGEWLRREGWGGLFERALKSARSKRQQCRRSRIPICIGEQ